jgi:DNA-directed RNA polymerase specialized sigma24 family protein
MDVHLSRTESHVMSEGSVTHWIRELKEGAEGRAQEELWKRYFHRLTALARAKLKGVQRGAEDEEDVALSALNLFFDRVQHGHFPRLNDRDSLWPLLAKITARRAINQRNKALTQKRGGGKVRGESAFLGPDSAEEDEGGIAEVVGHEPTPAFAAELSERCDYLLRRLSWDLRLVARRKLEGYTNNEIATELGRVDRTIERKLDRIRAIWSAELDD